MTEARPRRCPGTADRARAATRTRSGQAADDKIPAVVGVDSPGGAAPRTEPARNGHGTVGGWRVPSEPPATAGHGIIGMRERAHLCGGKFSARPLAEGGFQVTASLPLPACRGPRQPDEHFPTGGRRAAEGGRRPDRRGRGVTISVAVADDQALVRVGFCGIIAATEGLTVVGEAANGAEAVAVARAAHPDVVLMDVRMPVLDGIEATRQITSAPESAGARVIILTTFDLDDYVFGALRAGASGFLLKDTLPADLITAIRVVAAGEALLAPSITRRLISEFARIPPLGTPGPVASGLPTVGRAPARPSGSRRRGQLRRPRCGRARVVDAEPGGPGHRAC